MADEDDGVGPFDATFEALGEASKLVGGGTLPEGFGGRIGDQFPIFHAAAGGWVDHSVGEGSEGKGGGGRLEEHLGEWSVGGFLGGDFDGPKCCVWGIGLDWKA